MRAFRFTRTIAVVSAATLLLRVGIGAAQTAEDSLERSYAEELPRTAPLGPEAALASFEVHPEFRLDLVAAEPLVHDPVAMAFDASGDLYVVEMRGYSEQRDENLGAVRLLKDTDGDGIFDVSHVFLDGLRWPTAVACWGDGVFIGVAPDILFARDTDGDHRADVVEKVYTGFQLTNVQGLLNTFKWGLDNRIHGAASLSGASVVPGDQPGALPLILRGRDFSFDPRTREIRAESGGGQHGLTFDEWGRRFVCHNSHQVIFIAYEDRYVARNPFLAAPAAAVDAAADGPSGDVFRISPVEPWRIVRTRLRVKGLVRGPIEGGGTAAGYFTSATGITAYKGDAWPEAYRGNLIVGDVGSNLIHRKTVSWPGVIPVAERARANTEFVRSSDNWFRPVQFANGPDGALYVADMYREVIEHPDSLPPIIKQHLDLTSGQDRGRIYRIVPTGFQQPTVPDLANADTGVLADLLSHPNAWHRETAARLLFERHDALPELSERAAETASPLGRVQALSTLDGLGGLSPETIAHALKDPHPRVREHAVRLAAQFLPGSAVVAEQIAELADDPDVLVRYRLAFVLGYASPSVAVPALTRLALRDPGDSWLRNAVLSSAAPIAADLLEAVLVHAKAHDRSDVAGWLEPLARQVGAASSAADVERTLSNLEKLPEEEEPLGQATVRGLIEGCQLGRCAGEIRRLLTESPYAARTLEGLLAEARRVAADAGAVPSVRAEALRTLALGTYEIAGPLLAAALDPRQPLGVQQAAASTLNRLEADGVAEVLLEKWPTLGPQVRGEAIEGLFASEGRLERLVMALEAGTFAATDLDSTRVQQLLEYPNDSLRERAQQALAEHAPDPRDDVVEAYSGALALAGNPARGRPVFEQNCAQCHRLGDVGHAVGPDLTTMAQAGPEAILVNVLDPNREVSPQYINYVIDTTDWGTYSGIIASETATSLTLRRAGGAEDRILRQNIESIRSTNLSIMPEGWEQSLSRENLADLIAFVVALSE